MINKLSIFKINVKINKKALNFCIENIQSIVNFFYASNSGAKQSLFCWYATYLSAPGYA